MIDVKLNEKELQKIKKRPMTTKQALSMQEVVNNALKIPVTQGQQINQPTTVNGFGRSV